jgi:hypothetical protein
MDYLREVRKFHAEAVEPFRGVPVGSTFAEIEALQREIGYPLPEAHRQFLLWMGRDYEGVFQGCNWFIDQIPSTTAYIPRLLAANDIPPELPERYLGFFSHQGYMAAWYALPKDDEDPPVWFFRERRKPMPAPAVEGRFTDFLLKDMRGFAAALAMSHALECQREQAEPGAAADRGLDSDS